MPALRKCRICKQPFAIKVQNDTCCSTDCRKELIANVESYVPTEEEIWRIAAEIRPPDRPKVGEGSSEFRKKTYSLSSRHRSRRGLTDI